MHHSALRNRIKDHRKVRLGDLIPHELNPRIHSRVQRQVLEQLYEHIGFARSVLAYELADGRLKMIDGHLRAEMTPNEIVDVEVLDINEDEAKALLLSIDPLASLAEYEEQTLAGLRDIVEQESEAIKTLWKELQQEQEQSFSGHSQQHELESENKFVIMIECKDEAEQIMLLERFAKQGFVCHAKIA